MIFAGLYLSFHPFCLSLLQSFSRSFIFHRQKEDRATPLFFRKKMTQKGGLFKGKQNKKSAPPSRHGKSLIIRKGKRNFKPSKVTKDMDADRDVTKFINRCNEMKAATAANKEGGQLSIVKPTESTNGATKQ
ncbi:2,3-bisphosphoglycerate-dependent phosphoglycerate mutase [Thalictrum thalictroides]|uniref:2,3-bisphosphoglycerate-dependent phosphoglycerate mutase n=1 Tax=Thalictrum thalictroides TaxID=46969 RepID=A0A7J6W3Q5_THATH|nr:2,3-bisphosphoglycerate-dependent phosphoglycerate mutase [Thalictrum thalictroides]